MTLSGSGNLVIALSASTGVDERGENGPVEFALGQNFPNPFNPSTTIPYAVPGTVAGETRLTIFNSSGQEVRTLVSGPVTPGRHTARWDGRDDRGRFVSSGMYVARLKTDGRMKAVKMSFLK
jgi:hypothetical protein